MKLPNSSYLSYIQSIREQYNQASKIDTETHQSAIPDSQAITKTNEGPSILLFSPHPDDECITGLLPLRLAREQGAKITNVAVTLGSLEERREERWEELQVACQHLDFECHRLDFRDIIQTAKSTYSNRKNAIELIQNLFSIYKPRAIFCPHAKDAHPTHRAVHQIILDSITSFSSFSQPVNLFYTEYWSTMEKPNLMIEASDTHLARLMYALSCHNGEVNRNPYHLTLPSWMMDNTRRGSELLSQPGGNYSEMLFSTLYKWEIWENETFCQPSKKILEIEKYRAEKSLKGLF